MRYLLNRFTWLCLTFLLVQQVIVASSTLWLVRLSEDIVAQEEIWANLALFLISLVLPYLPAAVMSVLLVRWEQGAIASYLWGYVGTNQSNLWRWTDQKSKQETLALLNSEALDTISHSVMFYFQTVSSGLNVFLNILTISVLVDGYFALAYGLSFVAGIGLVYLQAPKQASLTRFAQEARIRLRKSILSSWDNVLLGNRYNFEGWRRDARESVRDAIRKSERSAVFQNLVSIGIALVTFLPCLVVVVVSASQNLRAPTALAALVVTMPRLFLILSYTYDLLFLVTQWPQARVRLKRISEVLSPGDLAASEERLRSRAAWDRLSIALPGAKFSVQSWRDLLSITNSNQRVTIRGDNGSGKSSLLLWLKMQLGEAALYLPCQHDLFFRSNEASGSTGEQVRNRLEEIMAEANARVLLLDEWDANLDSENQASISEMLTHISSQICVVESRHRF